MGPSYRGTGVHMAVTLWEQLTGKAGAAQITINPAKPYGLSINMGGDDVTVIAVFIKKEPDSWTMDDRTRTI